MSIRVNAIGLTEAIDELVGGDPMGQHLPICFRAPSNPDHLGKTAFYFRLSIEMATEKDAARPFRAMVITPDFE